MEDQVCTANLLSDVCKYSFCVLKRFVTTLLMKAGTAERDQFYAGKNSIESYSIFFHNSKSLTIC